ncbi:MAG TPA: hypothetical protein VGC65_06005, partial [Bacteroidia bacterium]
MLNSSVVRGYHTLLLFRQYDLPICACGTFFKIKVSLAQKEEAGVLQYCRYQRINEYDAGLFIRQHIWHHI